MGELSVSAWSGVLTPHRCKGMRRYLPYMHVTCAGFCSHFSTAFCLGVQGRSTIGPCFIDKVSAMIGAGAAAAGAAAPGTPPAVGAAVAPPGAPPGAVAGVAPPTAPPGAIAGGALGPRAGAARVGRHRHGFQDSLGGVHQPAAASLRRRALNTGTSGGVGLPVPAGNFFRTT